MTKAFARAITYAEPYILISAICYFWYASNFPNPSGASGVDRFEWVWLGVLLVAISGVLLAWKVAHTDDLSAVGRGAAVIGLLAISVGTLWLLRPSIDPDSSRYLAVDRADWFWLLALLVPVYLARWYTYGSPWKLTLYDPWLLALIVLCVVNVDAAPYPSRGLGMLMRPLLGMALLLAFVTYAAQQRDLRPLLVVTLALSTFVAVIALGATQWTTKSAAFEGIIAALPTIQPFFASFGFNPNEIAGVMTWLAPLTAGLALYRWHWTWRTVAAVTFVLLMLALVLGQSRFALIGVGGALVVAAVLVAPARWRLVIIGVVGVAVVAQAVILFNLLPFGGDAEVGLSERDRGTSSQRFDIWDAAFDLIEAHPLTGVGMNRWRYGPVARAFPVIGYDIPNPDDPDEYRQFRLPHAHNEFVQIATDLGLPGLVVFCGLYLTAAYMLWFTWRNGDQQQRRLAVFIGAGLLAHIGYGMGDAVPIWDRFSFVFWMLLGLAGAQYVIVRAQARETTPDEVTTADDDHALQPQSVSVPGT